MNAPEPTLWVDGELVPWAAATIHVLGQSVQRGTTVFDVLPVVQIDGRSFGVGLAEHVVRFGHSMTSMGMEPAHDGAALTDAVIDVVRANPGTASIKLVATWSEPSHEALPVSTVPQITIAPSRPDSAPPPSISVMTSSVPKIPPAILPPAMKAAAAYTPGIRAKLEARKLGYDEVVLKTLDGELAESVTASVFVGTGDRLAVPPLDAVLDGITRRLLLDLGEAEGVPVDVRAVPWDEVESADELFWSSSNRPVVPVDRHDGRRLPAPGPLTAVLAAGVEHLTRGRHHLSERWLTEL